MKIDEIITENKELEIKYSRAVETITKLQKKVARLERKNSELLKRNNVLKRAIEIALETNDHEKQVKHLKQVLEKIKEGEEK